MNTSIATSEAPVPGALYSVDDGEGNFRVAKVLVVDEGGVHIRLYKNKFAVRPLQVDVLILDLGSIHDPEGFGMGHLPLAHAAYLAWEPVFLMWSVLDGDELEGYRYWQDTQGGYFGVLEH